MALARELHVTTESLDAFERLPPGLYATVPGSNSSHAGFDVHFEPRRIENVSYPYPKTSFESVRNLSERTSALYELRVGP